ncbi:MAG: NAD-dependent epimerase/dehydratase family protein [Calothrix sp. C42_A2020_038]|nr:NAD-dependent epimerase/dehydratase family protein [Calothrix sp. C42_A2020_038]
MNVLVTGATGFLGRKLAERLNLSHQVTVLGRNQKVGKQLESQGMRFLAVDIRDADGVLAACKRQDYVFHCAALSSPWGKYKDFYNTNVVGTRNVVRGCEIYEIKRLIHVSTSCVYFNYSHRLNISETDVLPEPANGHIMTKLLAEGLVNRASQRKLSVISIRPRAIFGLGRFPILPQLMTISQKTGIPLINGGKALVDITYVDNVVDALLLCQTAPDNLSGRTFNITNGQPMHLIDLLRIISHKLGSELKLQPVSYGVADNLTLLMELISKRLLLGREPILTRYTLGTLAFSQTLDITAALSELNYQPRITIETGLDIFGYGA